jgi:3-dehydroquinate synthase II
VHADGIHRVLSVGRVKIERRPHTLVHWKTSDGRNGNAVLQTAETVRLVAADGRAVAVTDLKPGQQILVHSEDVARHTGLPVDSQLEER